MEAHSAGTSSAVKISVDGIKFLPQCIYIEGNAHGHQGTRIYFAEIVGMHIAHRSSGSTFARAAALPQPLLVLVTKRTESRFNKTFAPLLELVNLDYRIALLENKRHCALLIKNYDVAQYDGIFVLESVGMLSEIVSSMIRREDRFTTGKMPICWISNNSKEPSAACLATAREVMRRKIGKGRKYKVANSICRSLAQRTLACRRVAHLETGKLHHALVDHMVAGAGGNTLRRFLLNGLTYREAVKKLRGRDSIHLRISFILDESTTNNPRGGSVPQSHMQHNPGGTVDRARYRRRAGMSAPPHFGQHGNSGRYTPGSHGNDTSILDDTSSVISGTSSAWPYSTQSVANSAFPYSRPETAMSGFQPGFDDHTPTQSVYASSLYNRSEPDAFNALIYRTAHCGQSRGSAIPPLHQSISLNDAWTQINCRAVGFALVITGMQHMELLKENRSGATAGLCEGPWTM